MKSLKTVRNGLLASIGLFMSASCANNTANSSESASATATADSALKIAYIEVDSFMTQYQYCIDFSEILLDKSDELRGKLNGKAKALENQVKQFQAKIQANEFTSQEQYERAQNKIVKQEQELQAEQQKMAEAFELEQIKYNVAMRDSIQAFLKEYNQEKGYTYIMSKAGDNILLANPQNNITDEVIQGLNKRYKGIPEAAE